MWGPLPRSRFPFLFHSSLARTASAVRTLSPAGERSRTRGRGQPTPAIRSRRPSDGNVPRRRWSASQRELLSSQRPSRIYPARPKPRYVLESYDFSPPVVPSVERLLRFLTKLARPQCGLPSFSRSPPQCSSPILPFHFAPVPPQCRIFRSVREIVAAFRRRRVFRVRRAGFPKKNHPEIAYGWGAKNLSFSARLNRKIVAESGGGRRIGNLFLEFGLSVKGAGGRALARQQEITKTCPRFRKKKMTFLMAAGLDGKIKE